MLMNLHEKAELRRLYVPLTGVAQDVAKSNAAPDRGNAEKLAAYFQPV